MQATVGGLQSLTDAVAAARGTPPPAARLLAEFARVFVEQARLFAPARSGALRDSIQATMTDAGLVIQAGVPYAISVLSGVQPQYMTWLLGKTVSFIARDGTRATRRVTFVGSRNGRRHWYTPGMPPRDFLRLAWESAPVQALVDRLRAEGVELAVAFLYSSTNR